MSDLTELAARLVACPEWRWMPGMVTLGGWRVAVVEYDAAGLHLEAATDLGEPWTSESGLPDLPSSLPDLTDRATVGCLLLAMLPRGSWWLDYDAETDQYAVVFDIRRGDCELYWATELGETERRRIVAAQPSLFTKGFADRRDETRWVPLVPRGPDPLMLPGHTLTGHRFRNYLSNTVFRQSVEMVQQPGRITIEGGYSGLARALNLTSKNAAKQLADLVTSWKGISLALPGGSQLSVISDIQTAKDHPELAAAHGRRERLVISVGAMWLPDAPKLHPALGVRLVPVVSEPPLDGVHEKSQAAAVSMDLGAIVHVREHEIVRFANGEPMEIPWGDLAAEAGFPTAKVAALLAGAWKDRWPKVGSRYRLVLPAPDAPAVEFMRQSAQASIDGRKGGRKATDRKARARTGKRSRSPKPA